MKLEDDGTFHQWKENIGCLQRTIGEGKRWEAGTRWRQTPGQVSPSKVSPLKVSPRKVSPLKVSPGKVYDQNLVQLCGAIDASSEQSSCSDEHQHLARCGEDDTGQVGEGSLAERHLSRRLLLVLLLLLLSVDKEGAESVPASGDAATVKSKESRKKGRLGGAIKACPPSERTNSKCYPKAPDRSRRQVFPPRTRDRRSAARGGRCSPRWQTP